MTRAPTRRDVLRWGALGAAFATLPGCDAGVWLGGALDPLPDRVGLLGGEAIDPVFHLLSRATYGPRPGEVQRVKRLGTEAWIEEQLAPEGIDDWRLDARLVAQCESVHDHPNDLLSVPNEFIEKDLNRATLLRAVHTRRQLQEVMTGFWTDHFSIDIGKRGCMETKPLDDRSVIRKHALGTFRDLVHASALSPAMLIYLDGRENRKRTPEEQPNENYARELMELHTLGVHGGYTQKDVMEAARCLTGWTYKNANSVGDAFAMLSGKAFIDGSLAQRNVFASGAAVFRPEWHDDGEKVVMGKTIPAGGGPNDLDELLEIVCEHPATARYVCSKLVRRLVADPAPTALVDSAAAVFTKTYGDIKQVVRHLLTSDEFAQSTGTKVKRPFRFVVSALRALGAESQAGRPEIESLERLGHVPHHYPTPDGFPEEPEPYMGTLLWRWNFALRLATGQLGPTTVNLKQLTERCGLDPKTASPTDLAPLLYGRVATDAERQTVATYEEAAASAPRGAVREEGVALLLAAPAFQVH